MKIGQEVKFKNDFKIKAMISGKVLHVKEGDKAIATKNGLKILTGEARGKITEYIDEQPKGFDYMNISKMIFDRLDAVFGLELFLDDEAIDSKEFIEEIEDVIISMI